MFVLPNSAPDSLTPRNLNLVLVAEQVPLPLEGAGAEAVVDVWVATGAVVDAVVGADAVVGLALVLGRHWL